MKLVDLDSSNRFASCERVEIVVRKTEDTNPSHHCDALILSETSDGLVLLCALPCIEALRQTFLLRRYKSQDPVEVSLSAVVSHVRVQERDFGFVHIGVYL